MSIHGLVNEMATAQKTRRTPLRSCVVCRQPSDKKTLLRVVRAPEKDGGGVSADPSGKANGRGAYVCASAECIDKAVKQKRFERALSASPLPSTLAEELKALSAKVTELEVLTEKVMAAATSTGATAT